MPVTLVPINAVSYQSEPWLDAVNGMRYGGAFYHAGTLYVLTMQQVAAPVTSWNVWPNGYGQIWKSTDQGATWHALATETNLTSAEWNLQWSYYWDGTGTITFLMEQTGKLVDFNVTTETWGTPYATNWGAPPSGFSQVVKGSRLARLSDGRLRVFYQQLGAANDQVCWAVASGGGSWTSKDNVVYIPVFPGETIQNCVPQSTCVDSNDRAHLVMMVGSTTGQFQFNYANIDTSNTVSPVSTLFSSSGGESGNILAASDGKLYFGLAVDDPYIFVGSSWSSPAWTQTLIESRLGPPTYTGHSPLVIFDSGGVLNYLWLANFSSPNYWAVRYSQFSGGSWTAGANILDFRTDVPSAPLTPDLGTWSAVGVSGAIVPSGYGGVLDGIGLVPSLDTVLPGGSPAWVAYYIAGAITISVACPTTSTATVGHAYSGSLSASGGTPPYTFSITSGGLPPGLSLNTLTGAITGTPTTIGSYPYTAEVTDSLGLTATATCSIAVSSAISLSCPPGSTTTGSSYSGPLAVSGGTAPYTFTLTSGPLPPGLSLNTSTGVISGTPTTAGSYPYTVKVTDSSGVSATAIVSCSIAVSQPAAPMNPGNVEFTLRRVYVSMIPNKRVPVRGR